MYLVIRRFHDTVNIDHVYEVGDTYPVDGYKPTKARINKLLNGTNKYGQIYLQELEESAIG